MGLSRVVLVVAAALLGLVLWMPGLAHADPAPAPVAPYGGALDAPDPGDEISFEQVLEVAMLTLGALNGVAVIVAVAFHRVRGSSTAATRDALRRRTDAGVVSESRRERRERAEGPAGPVPVVDPEPVLPALPRHAAAAPRRYVGPGRPPRPQAPSVAPPPRPAVPTARPAAAPVAAAPVAGGAAAVAPPAVAPAGPPAAADGAVPAPRAASPVSPARGLPLTGREFSPHP